MEVVIVSFNTREILKNCLKSLTSCLKNENLAEKSEVTVVDNNSHDGSVSMVRKYFPDVKLIANRNNPGFAAANNQAIKKSRAEIILLLNSDTVVLPDALTVLLNEFNHKSICVAGPKLLNPDYTLQQSLGFYPDFLRIAAWMLFIDDLPVISEKINPYHAQNPVYYSARREVGWVSGAALMFRKKIIESAGMMDEKIFMYGEEVEWCYRIGRTGGKIIFNPHSEIIHLGGASSKTPGESILREFAAVKYFYSKYRDIQLIPVRLLLKIGALLRLVVFGIIGRQTPKISLYANAFKVA